MTVSYHIEEYSPYTSGYTPWMIDPQELNRYSYALNNPLKYTDPEGNQQTNPIAQAAQALWQSGVPQLRVLAWGLLIAAGAYEIYNTQQGTGSSVGSTLVEVVKTAVDLTKTVVGKIGNYLFAKQDKSREAYDQHKQNLDSLRNQLKDKERELERATGPKSREPIQRDIDRLQKKITGEEKEMNKQKWPKGPPQP